MTPTSTIATDASLPFLPAALWTGLSGVVAVAGMEVGMEVVVSVMGLVDWAVVLEDAVVVGVVFMVVSVMERGKEVVVLLRSGSWGDVVLVVKMEVEVEVTRETRTVDVTSVVEVTRRVGGGGVVSAGRVGSVENECAEVRLVMEGGFVASEPASKGMFTMFPGARLVEWSRGPICSTWPTWLTGLMPMPMPM